MDLLDSLPFISGWNYEASRDLTYTNINKTNPITGQTPKQGWFIGLQAVVTDSTAEITMQGDNFVIEFSPDTMQETGLTQWNPTGPHSLTYNRMVGTEGIFSMGFSPVNPLPISKQLNWSLLLGQNSTQTSCYGQLTIVFITIVDSVAFLNSYKSLLTSLGLTNLPAPKQIEFPKVRKNLLNNIQISRNRMVTEDQELQREGFDPLN